MKKSLFLFSLAFLSTTTAFCQTVEIEKNNVVYTATKGGTSSVQDENGDPTVTVSEPVVDKDAHSAQISIMVTTDIHKTTTVNYDLTVKSFAASNGIELGGWSVNNGNYDFSETTKTESTAPTTIYDLDDDGETYTPNWAKYSAYLDGKLENVLSASQIKSNSVYANATFYGWGDENSFTYAEWDDLGYEDDYYYVMQKASAGRGKYKYTFYAINVINYSSSTTTEEYTITNYNYSTIPTGLPMSPVTSLTIGNKVTEIADGAFAEATVLETISNNSTSFCMQNGFLYTANFEKLVAVPSYISGTSSEQSEYALPEKTTSVAENALGNVNYVTLTTYNSITQDNLGGTSNKIEIQSLSISYDVEEITMSSDVLTYSDEKMYGVKGTKGTVTATSLAELLAELNEKYPSQVRYIDLSSLKWSGSDELDLTLPDNCLLFLNSGAEVTGDTYNVVVKGDEGSECDWLLVKDGVSFYSPKNFKVAGKATYSGRSVKKNNYVTCMFPFNIPSNATVTANGASSVYSDQKVFRVMTLNDYDQENNRFSFYYTTAAESNTPYVLKSMDEISGDMSFTPTSTPISVVKSSSSDYASSGLCTVLGTYKTAVLTSTENRTAYLFSGGNPVKLKVGAKGTLNPFRGGFYVTAGSESSAKPTFVFCEADGSVDDEVATGVESAVESNNAVAVSVEEGKLAVSASDAKVKVASISGMSIFEGKVSGKKVFSLSKGVYVVNGKKYEVK